MRWRTPLSDLIESQLGEDHFGKSRWPVAVATICVSAFLVLFTDHPHWLIRVGLLGLALITFLFFTETATKWIVTVGMLAIAFMLIFYRLGEGSLYDWDEAIYAQVSKEMFHSHQWEVLTWNAAPFLQKPPLQFWLTTLAYSFIGVNELAARFWAALFGFGVIVLTLILGWRMAGWSVGAAAALLLLTVDHEYFSHFYNFVSLARVGMLETSLIFWTTLAILLGWESRKRPWFLTMAGVSVGLAVMTKAWAGLFPLPVLLTVDAFTNRSRSRIRFWIVAGVFAAVIVMPWHLWELWQNGTSFIHEYVGVNLMGRVTGTIEGNQQRPWFYFNIISFAFPFWKYFLPPVFIWAVWKALQESSAQHLLLLTWVALPLTLFSFSQTKLGWYISVTYPALALLLAIVIAEFVGRRVVLVGIALIMALCCVRLPLPSDGSRDIKRFADTLTNIPAFSRIFTAAEKLPCTSQPTSIYEHDYHDNRVPPALLFYMNSPLTCIVPRDADLRFASKGSYLATDRIFDRSVGWISVYITD